MNAKRKLDKYGIFISLIVLVFSLTACASSSASAVPLEEFKSGTEYQYGKMKWGLPVDEVMDVLSYDIAKDESRGEMPDNSEYAFYKSKNQFYLDKQKAFASFEFQNKGLSIVKFDFTLGEDYEQWFNAQVEKMKQIYGEESDKKESESDKFKSTIYTWEADNSMLQIILMTGSTIKPAATIGVGVKP